MDEKYLYNYSYTGHYKVAACYPNSYHIGMSNLGFLSLFHFLSSTDGIKVDRYFIERDGNLFSPEINSGKSFSKSGKGLNLSIFDALFFSISFEMDYLNIVKMLQLSNINPIYDKRSENDPLIVVGGISVTANPKPMSVISDVVFLGDMEAGLEGLLKLLFEQRFKKSKNLLSDISQLPGFYIKGISSDIPKKSVRKPVNNPAHSVVITKNTVFSNRFLIEIARGCKNSCRFCMTRTSNFPPRSIDKNSILDVVKRAKSYTSLVGLISPVLTDNTDLLEIIEELNRDGMVVSFSSLRADRYTEDLAKLIRENRQRSVTFAPETGSDSLRKKIGKLLTNDQLMDSVSLSVKYGLKNLRYYFMYGLPFERWRDIESIIDLVKNTIEILGNYGKLHLSINPFIPKKNTPFENERIWDLDYYYSVKNYLIKNLKRIKGNKNLSLRFESLKFIYTHYFLSIGEERTGFFIAENSFGGGISSIENYFRKLYWDGINPNEY